ncbi:MAG: hypothetical protein A3G21_07360 [Acidobacteria bacterium RIFCSPLOWO2_12_FULL_66_21]|nr:MAG: hypothetical protein A3G21_07360 [Acidobacteria bacterium RIFCSPLOWO2_12_FULL_66_21]
MAYIFVLLLCAATGAPAGQVAGSAATGPPFYVLPLWLEYQSAGEETVTREVQELRRRLGPESPRVRLGFTTYVFLSMDDWNVDVSDRDALHRALEKNILDVDRAIDRARRHNIPLCLSFMSAIRERYDPVQKASELEDRRNMQWYADNSLAGGWWTHSRYARKQRRVQEAYFREIGRIVANRMAKYPDTLVAASGDGEVELAYDKSPIVNKAYTTDTMLLADYSPFAVAEFRDWLRGRGLYNAGGPFSGQGYENAARYAGDVSPAADTNRDGHTLNGDFGTSFTTWTLRFFDWSLEDDASRDPHAIPAAVAQRPGWDPFRSGPAGGFDPPRAWKQGDPWWEIWHRFRQVMLWRHNREVAEWVTTSRDARTKTVVPADRWYSDQIAGDYLFGGSPENPNLRFITSASAWWTGDVAPHGRLGITSFNVNLGGTVFRTLAAVAPQIGERDVEWGILEWHPSSPETKDLEVYRSEARLVELYRPALVVPIYWGDPHTRIQDSGFEVALRELVAAMSKGPIAPTIEPAPGRLNFGATSDGRVTPSQRVRIQVVGRGRTGWTATSSDPAVVMSRTSGAGSADIDVSVAADDLGAADRRVSITIAAPQSSTPRVEIPVLVRPINGTGAPPHGAIGVPADGATVTGAVEIAGWALDDIGVTKVEVGREPGPGDPPTASALIRLGEAARGARADVTRLFPDAPLLHLAAWYLRYDTTTLAGPEPRTCRLHVLVTDVEGHVTDLGVRRVTIPSR